MGVPAGGGHRMFVHTPQGFPYGLLQHDMVERFLLYFFTHSAHTNTRGTFTTPESSTLTCRACVYAYASAGVANVPMCLKVGYGALILALAMHPQCTFLLLAITVHKGCTSKAD